MNQYFIIVDSTQPKNNLDRALQSSFEPFEHKLIGEEQLYILELTYRAALLGYQSGGGRCSGQVATGSRNSTASYLSGWAKHCRSS